jgi:hypothetical protein
VSVDLASAWVDPAYETGRINFGNNLAQLKRFGPEWLVVEIEPVPIIME